MSNKLQIPKVGTNTSYEDSNIYLLSQLKPAGTKLLLQPNKSDLGDLIKLTLFDLVLKQVLIVKRVYRKAHPRDKYEREYIVVETAKNFSEYQPYPFEHYFVDRIDEDSYYQLRPFLQGIAKDISSKRAYKELVIKNLTITELFVSWLRLLGWLFVNEKGKKVRQDIETYMTQMDQHMAKMVEEEPKKAMELIGLLGGNIFLLENLEFETLARLKEVSIEKPASGNWSWIDLISELDISVFDVFDEVSDVWDDMDDYFDFSDFGGDWDVGFDGDFD